MTSAGSTATRQLPGTGEEWHRLSLWAALPTALALLRPRVLATLLPGLLATVIVLREVLPDGRWGFAATVGGAAVAGLGGWIGWALAWRHRFRYRVDAAGISLRSGVLHRNEVRLEWERVRNVDVRQAFYFRPLDRVTLILEGTGGSEEVISVPAVTRAVAEDVRRRAIAVPTVGTSAPLEVTTPEAAVADGVLHRPSPAALLTHGAINGRAFALLLAGIGVLYSVLNPFLEEAELVRGVAEQVSGLAVESLTGWLLLAVPVLLLLSVVLVVISAVAALVLYWSFTLSVDGDRYLFTQGLVETQERSLRATKLQALTTVETAVGRLFGRCHLLVHKATTSADSDGEQEDGSLLVPALSTREGATLVQRLDPAAAPRPPLQQVERAFRRFWLQRLLAVVVILAVVAVVGAAVWLDADGAVLMLLGVLAAAVILATVALIHTAWRNWGWALDGTVLFITHGVFGRHHVVFRLDRVQHVAVTRSPYQRRHGLATLRLALPDGDRTIPFLDEADAVELANRTVHRVETDPHLEL